MSNKSNGNCFEREMAKMLSDKGCWVHIIRDNENGQPFDLIAVRRSTTTAIDCKLCLSDSFKLSRIEDNQRLAFEKFNRCAGAGRSVLALKFVKHDSIVFMTYEKALYYKNQGKKSVTYDELTEGGGGLWIYC